LNLVLARWRKIPVLQEFDSVEAALGLALFPSPHLILIDGSAIDVDISRLAEFRAKNSQCRVVVVVDVRDAPLTPRYIQAGVSGLLDAECSVQYLVQTLSRILEGEMVVAASLFFPSNGLTADPATNQRRLTTRESEIAKLVAVGQSNMQIATRLVITENTVKGHLVNIFAKLEIENRVQLANYAFANGLTDGFDSQVPQMRSKGA
jgi:DNA-binding NarL/FixJ family response regulator